MSRTYKATGINLKGAPLGESDRLLTVLTREHGLIRVVAPGARKHHSKLGGRSGLFVVNELLISKGRSLDKITQAETLESYPGLSQDLAKLTASQYLAELVLCQALSDQPQEELFCLFNEHLCRLESLSSSSAGNGLASFGVLAHLAQAVFHLLALAGVAPQVQTCCVTQRPLTPNLNDDNWRIGFNMAAGGAIDLAELEHLGEGARVPSRIKNAGFQTTKGTQGNTSKPILRDRHSPTVTTMAPSTGQAIAAAPANYHVVNHQQKSSVPSLQLNAVELSLLQHLAQPELLQLDAFSLELEQNAFNTSAYQAAWLKVERILRQCAQYHFDRPIRSAALIDTCFLSVPTAP
ncbi:DNA repair protein RecO [Trichocoleus sp. FACHB-591]|uniref:DNA repair protein RecO n=1 Tax=Trichocoleus sp. FACHB-591 TaxID=2692872 RepID=UPI00168314AA|nr:DNA repair protein RecO [Trichocoleus sp. FACHB-591]MBD2097604.1 DNA repair protein RecO [Trichocoleus sp. FACHB-591]